MGSLRLPWPAILFLLLTAAAALLRSHYLLLHGDDLLELWCDRVASLSQLLHIERFSALAVDPFLNHALIYTGIRLFGMRPMLLMLPALCGFLLMQICIFRFVRRLASTNAAIFALALPAITGTIEYADSVRSYGLLLGFFGLAMVSWQSAVYDRSHRSRALVLLAVSIALCINTHYYGVLLLTPLLAAEAVRFCENGRPDTSILLSIAAGIAGFVFVVPFMGVATGFRSHYPTQPVPYQVIFQTYSFILTGRSQLSVHANRTLEVCFVVAAAAVLASCLRRTRAKPSQLPIADFVFLVVLAALPFVGFLLGRVATHAMETRYALGAVIAISALLAIATDPWLRRPVAGSALLVLLFFGCAAKGIADAHAERLQTEGEHSSMQMTPSVREAMLASPSGLLYTQDVDLFAFLMFHDSDTDLLKHLALVFSADEERRFNGSAASSMVCMNLKGFTPYTILPYEKVETEPGEHIFVVNEGGWNWVETAFAEDHLPVKPVGSLLGSKVVSVDFHPR